MSPAPVRTPTPAPPSARPRTAPSSEAVVSLLGDGAQDLGRMMGSTPGRMRLLSMLCVVLLTLAGVFATLASVALTSATDRINQNTAPVLIKTQDVFASFAEANSAAIAPQDDIEQRGIYLAAVERASRDLEDVARLVGDDATSHLYLKSIAEDLTSYTGAIERARENRDANALRRALNVVESDIIPLVRSSDASADTLTSRGSDAARRGHR